MIPVESEPKAAFLLFRLSETWWAMPTSALSEVITAPSIHTLPNHSNPLIIGIINFQGQLRACIDLRSPLGLVKKGSASQTSHKYVHMLVIQEEEEQWIFPVEEIHGVVHVDVKGEMQGNIINDKFEYEGKTINCIDDKLLFKQLKEEMR